MHLHTTARTRQDRGGGEQAFWLTSFLASSNCHANCNFRNVKMGALSFCSFRHTMHYVIHRNHRWRKPFSCSTQINTRGSNSQSAFPALVQSHQRKCGACKLRLFGMSDRHTFIPGECRYSDDSGRGKTRTRQNRVHEPRVLAAAAPGAGEGIRDTPRATHC